MSKASLDTQEMKCVHFIAGQCSLFLSHIYTKQQYVVRSAVTNGGFLVLRIVYKGWETVEWQYIWADYVYTCSQTSV